MPPDQDDSSDDAGVLSPEELDITDDENVVEIEEGRYVISAGSGPPAVPSGGTTEPDRTSPTDSPPDEPPREGHPETDPGPSATELDESSVHEWLRRDVSEARSQYGFDVTAKFEDSVSQQELFSNDVSTTFENLIVWYAQHVGGDTPVEEVLGILLMEANVSVRYPPKTVRALASTHGLSADDSIADLIEALEGRDGVSFPP